MFIRGNLLKGLVKNLLVSESIIDNGGEYVPPDTPHLLSLSYLDHINTGDQIWIDFESVTTDKLRNDDWARLFVVAQDDVDYTLELETYAAGGLETRLSSEFFTYRSQVGDTETDIINGLVSEINTNTTANLTTSLTTNKDGKNYGEGFPDKPCIEITSTGGGEAFVYYVGDSTTMFVAAEGSNPYSYSERDTIWAYYKTGKEDYLRWTANQIMQFICSEERFTKNYINEVYYPMIEKDTNLSSGDIGEKISLVYAYAADYLSASEKVRIEEYMDSHAYNLWNPETANWYGESAWWSGYKIGDPGNNYHYSFLLFTTLWALAAKRQDLIDFLNNEKFPALTSYWSAFDGGGSREGTSYGLHTNRVLAIYKQWQASMNVDMTEQDNGWSKTSCDFWGHATTPDRRQVCPIGDHSRQATHFVWDYDLNMQMLLSSVNKGNPHGEYSTYWLNESPVELSHRYNYHNALYELNITPSPLPTLTYHAIGAGNLFTRSDWTSDATYLYIVGGKLDQEHACQEQGGFGLWKGDGWQTVTQNMWTDTGINQSLDFFNVLRFEDTDFIGQELRASTYESASAHIEIDAATSIGEEYSIGLSAGGGTYPLQVFTFTSVTGAETGTEIAAALCADIRAHFADGENYVIRAYCDHTTDLLFLNRGTGTTYKIESISTNMKAGRTIHQLKYFGGEVLMDYTGADEGSVNVDMECSTVVPDDIIGETIWQRKIDHTKTRTRIRDTYSSEDPSRATFQLNVTELPVVQPDKLSVVCGDMTISVFDPIDPEIRIIDWNELGASAQPDRYKIEISNGSGSYDVFVQLPGDAVLPSFDVPLISEGNSLVPTNYGSFEIDLNAVVSIRPPRTIDWSSAVIVSDPSGGVDDTNLTTLGTILYTPTAGESDFTFTWQVDNNLGESSPVGEWRVRVTAENFPLVKKANRDPLKIEAAQLYVLQTTDLQYTSMNNTPAEIQYTATTLDAGVTVSLDGTELINGDTFTQADIDSGLVTLLSSNPTLFTMQLSVTDNGSPANTLNVTVSGEAELAGVLFMDSFSTDGLLVADETYSAAAKWTRRRDNDNHREVITQMAIVGGQLVGSGIHMGSGVEARVATINKDLEGDFEVDLSSLDLTGGAKPYINFGIIAYNGTPDKWGDVVNRSFELDPNTSYYPGAIYAGYRVDRLIRIKRSSDVPPSGYTTFYDNDFQNIVRNGNLTIEKVGETINVYGVHSVSGEKMLATSVTHDVGGGREWPDGCKFRFWIAYTDTANTLDEIVIRSL